MGNRRLWCAALVSAIFGRAPAADAYAAQAEKAAQSPKGKLSLKVDLALPTSEKDPGPLPAKPLPGYRGWAMGTGTGKGVTPIRHARNVDVTSVTSDKKVGKSVIRFRIDGTNDVLVIIDGGNDDYPDPARKRRQGSKAVLNAFRIEQIE